MTDADTLRHTVHEIILRLYKEGEVGQVQLIYMSARLAIQSMDPQLFERMRKEEYAQFENKKHACDAYDASNGATS